MKKNKFGIFLILIALLVLVRGFLPQFHFNVWSWLPILLTAIWAIFSLLQKYYFQVYFALSLTLLQLADRFSWFPISAKYVYTAFIFLSLGIYFLGKSNRKQKNQGWNFQGKTGVYSENKNGFDLIFSRTDKYYTDLDDLKLEMDLIFSEANLYFEQARLLGPVLELETDMIFSHVHIYLPANWDVQLKLDRISSRLGESPLTMPAEKTLIIKGNLIFSTLEIHRGKIIDAQADHS